MSDPQQNPRQHDQNLNALAAALLAAYAAAQVDLIAKFAALIGKYAIGDLLLIQLRKVAREAALGVSVTTPALVDQIVTQAAADGAKAAGPGAPTNPSFGVSGDTFESHAERSARAIREDLQGKLNQLSYRITRYADDAYQSVVTDAATDQLFGLPPHQAQHQAYTDLVRRGVDGITDSRGRKWELQAYVDMAVRTAAQRAFNVSHLDRMQALGIDLFMVDADGHPCPLCLPWEGAILSVDPDSRAQATIADATAAGLFHPRCFPGFVNVSAPSGVSAADSRWYDGEVVVIHTAAGNELTVTPNHPVLTPEGWVAAGQLEVGQGVIRYSPNVERVDVVRPNDEHVEARIGDVFEALRETRGVTTVTVPSSAEQFHGDGGDSDVEVVFVDGLLGDRLESAVGEHVGNGELLVGGVHFADLVGGSSVDELFDGLFDASDGIVGGGGYGLTLCAAHAAHAAAHGMTQVGAHSTLGQPLADFGLGGSELLADLALGETAGPIESDSLIEPSGLTSDWQSLARDSRGSNAVSESVDSDSNGGRDLAERFTRVVAADRIVEIERRGFSGHVYNLQSGDGWYVAESIVVHNCRHTLAGYFPGVTDVPEPHTWDAEDAARYAESQTQRRLEREIRAAKREQAGAYTPEMLTAANAAVRRAQANLREFIDQTGRVRITAREQIH